MKKIVALLVVVVLFSVVSTGCGQTVDSVLSKNFNLHPYQKVNGINERTITCKSNKIDVAGIEFITPILKKDKNKVSLGAFYQDLLTYQVLESSVKLSGKLINKEHPYPNVFYLFDVSNDPEKIDYVVIFYPLQNDMHTLIFKVNPAYMYDLISCLKDFDMYTQQLLKGNG